MFSWNFKAIVSLLYMVQISSVSGNRGRNGRKDAERVLQRERLIYRLR